MTNKSFDELLRRELSGESPEKERELSDWRPSAAYRRWERELLRDPFGKNAHRPLSWYRTGRVAARLAGRAAAVLLAASLSLSAIWSLAPQEARARAWGVIMDWLPDNASFSGSLPAADPDIPVIYYAPTYIPKGFELVDQWDPFDDGSTQQLRYENADGDRIIFRADWATTGVNMGIDNERDESYTTIISGRTAYVFESYDVSDMHSIVWEDNRGRYIFILHVENTLPVSEAIAIAESVQDSSKLTN